MTRHKKVLVISHNALSFSRNNGKTISSLFKNWPKDQFAQLYFNNEVPESAEFTNFFRIRDVDVLRTIFLFWSRSKCGAQIAASVPSKATWFQARSNNIRRYILGKLELLKLSAREVIFYAGFWQSRTFFDWARNFKPEAVFFVGGDSIFSFRVAHCIVKYFNVPLYIYITDDYILHKRPGSFLAKKYRSRLIRMYSKSFLEAEKVFVIGEAMAREFHEHFDVSFIPVMNAIDVPAEVSFEKYSQKGKACRIVYAGGFHLGRLDSIIQFAKVLEKIRTATGMSIYFDIYSGQIVSDQKRLVLDEYGAVFRGSIFGEELDARLRDADILLHVESFEPTNIDKTRLSVSTKIPEYLFSGSCVIGFGPSQVASIKLLEDNNIGMVVTEKDTEQSAGEKISGLLCSRSKQFEFASWGFEYAKSNLSGEVMREKVCSVINKS